MKSTCLLTALLALALLAATPAPTGAGSVRPGRVPAGPPVFSDPLSITNPFMPFVAGAVKVFNGQSGRLRTTTVDLYLESTRTFRVRGVDVPTRILQETSFENGEIVEISRNHFAQADDGTVYYFGEVVDLYEEGAVAAHDGSWLVGGPTRPEDPPDTAVASVPAVFMPADPEPGDTFKPEDLFPIVDETDTVIGVDRQVTVPAGRFSGGIRIRETTRLDSGREVKWYVPGVGVVRAEAKNEWSKLIATTLRP